MLINCGLLYQDIPIYFVNRHFRAEVGAHHPDGPSLDQDVLSFITDCNGCSVLLPLIDSLSGIADLGSGLFWVVELVEEDVAVWCDRNDSILVLSLESEVVDSVPEVEFNLDFDFSIFEIYD